MVPTVPSQRPADVPDLDVAAVRRDFPILSRTVAGNRLCTWIRATRPEAAGP